MCRDAAPKNQSSPRGARAAAVAVVALCAVVQGVQDQAASPDSARATVRDAERRRIQMVARAAESVVCIFSDRERSSGGSGVIISEDGTGLTNFHVVQPFLDSREGFGGLSDGKLYPLRVLGIDPSGDIAMFRLSGRERFVAAPLADSDALHVGQWVAAMGNPFLVAEDFTPTLTVGIISGLHRYQEGQGNLLEYADCIQVSTSINPGNSGGPLFDMDGRVIGINGRASFEERGRVNVGLGYAVTINQVRRFLPGLRAGRLVEHGALGATVRGVGSELMVDAIQDFSAAEKCGLALGDMLTHVAGRPVRTPNEFNNVQAILPADWPVRLQFMRDGTLHAITARTDRLTTGLPLVYLVDLEHNHAEIGRQLERFEQRARIRNADAAAASCELRVGPSDASGTQPIVVRVGADADACLGLHSLGPCVQDASAIDWSAEWGAICHPLLWPPRIELGWELIGGDEIAGCVASVVERRCADGVRLRWKFAYDDDALLQATIGDDQQPECIRWTVALTQQSFNGAWPTAWVREGPEGRTWIVQVGSFSVADAPPASRPTNATEPSASAPSESGGTP